MPIVKIGIMSQEKIRERTIAIASGQYKPKKGEPKIWFPSLKALGEVLSDPNRELLRVISDKQPESVAVLASMTGRKPSNLSRTLRTMANYGLVELERGIRGAIRPIAKGTRFEIRAD